MILIQINGATATDDRDGDISSKIEISGKVDTKKAGTYKITYTVKDAAGNVATAIRTIIVKGEEQQTPSVPQIKLNGSKTITIKVGDTYVDERSNCNR